MVEQNIGLAQYYVARYFSKTFPDHVQDMIQEGCLGIMEAVCRYDQSKGKFSTYAMWWIRAYVLVYMVRLQFERNFLSPFFGNGEENKLWWCPENKIIDADKVEHLLTTLKRECNDIEYQILTMKYCDGYSVREMAQETGLMESKIKSTMTQAIRRIRKIGWGMLNFYAIFVTM